MSVSTEYVNAFLDGTINVIDILIGEKPIKNEVFVQDMNFKSEGFAVIVGISEGGKGRVLLDMSLKTAIKMGSLISGEEITELNDDLFILLSELGNMISGNGITQINNSNKGLNLRLTPPSVFYGDGLEISSPNLSSVGVKFILSFGEISLNIAFESRKGKN